MVKGRSKEIMKLLSPTEQEFIISQGYGPSYLMLNVVYAQYNSSYGNNVIIQNEENLVSRTAHMNRIDVVLGQYLKVGDNLGLSGNTGDFTSGPHCHWD